MAHDERTARRILAVLDLAGAELRPLGFGLSSEAWLIGVGRDLVLRIATDSDDGPPTYPAEHAIMAHLTALGASVPAPVRGSWEVDGWPGPAFSLTMFVAGSHPELPLRPSGIAQVGAFLRLLHGVPVSGFGPVVPDADALQPDQVLPGAAADALTGIREWMRGAPIWPFDRSRLDDHPALVDRAELRARLTAQREAVERAGIEPPGVLVHTDLHEENILDDHGRLGFIDFGVAFVGAPAWDFAALAYFCGWPMADDVFAAYAPDLAAHAEPRRSIAELGLSFGLYRWWQDRQRGIDEESHDERFILESLDRMT